MSRARARGTRERHNLPLHRTRLIGRERDVAAVRQAVLEREGHLVTLTGAGGCGKTRLALQAGRDLVDAFADGVWVVELAPLVDPLLVPQAVARALEVTEQPGRPILETLLAKLQSRQLLLVLDNCEHLVDACAQLADRLLTACPRLRLLATSREPLRISGEIAWPVAPLAVPDPRQLPAGIAEAGTFPAVQLFVERAQAAQPNFALTAANATAVAQICATVEGLPLALELAAARVRALTAEQIGARLDDVLRVLIEGSRTAPTRQQTLRATFEWSEGLLSQAERSLFRRLAVFAGGWTLEAAEAVCGGNGIEPGDVLGLLAQLVEKSLVAAEAVSGGIGEMRYRFLEPTRQYAFQRLAASGELGVVERQHTAYYRGLATEGDEHWRGPWELLWLARLDQDLDNIRSAVKHTLADGDAEAFVRMGIRMCRFWEVRGYTEEGARWLDEALARAAAWPASVQMHVVRQAMFLEWLRGGFERAELLSGQYLNLAQELGDEVRINNARFFAALFLWMNHGTVDGPLATLEESLAFWRMWREREKVNIAMRQAQAEAAGAALWDNMFLGHALTTLGWLHLERGELEDAQAFFDESVSNARSGGDATQEAWGLAGQALVAHSRGDQQDATRLGRQALAAVRRLGDKGSIRFCLDLLGIVAASHGQVERAGRLFGAAQTVYETTHAWPIGLNYRALYAQHERVVAAMRAGANAASFSAAWERGRRLPLHEATAYAMSDEEPKVSGTEAAGGSIGAGPLSPREREVVALVARGLSNREIAAQLVITERTAGAHVEHILDKLGFASRTQIGVWAAEHGLVTSRPERKRAAGLADWEISQ